MAKLDGIADIQILFSERLKDFAFENGCNVSEMKILICTNPKNEIQFNLYVNDVFVRKLEIKEDVLGIKTFDFLLKETKLKMALSYIQGAFREEFARVYGECKVEEIMVFIYSKTDEPINVLIEKYKQGHREDRKFVTWEELEELF